MKYFHELTEEEIKELVELKRDWKYVMDNYKQPDWCTYYEALAGVMGCWSLTDTAAQGLRASISKKFCAGCDCFKNI